MYTLSALCTERSRKALNSRPRHSPELNLLNTMANRSVGRARHHLQRILQLLCRRSGIRHCTVDAGIGFWRAGPVREEHGLADGHRVSRCAARDVPEGLRLRRVGATSDDVAGDLENGCERGEVVGRRGRQRRVGEDGERGRVVLSEGLSFSAELPAVEQLGHKRITIEGTGARTSAGHRAKARP